MTTKPAIAASLACAIAFALPAAGQSATTATTTTTTTAKPVDIEADQMEVFDKEKRTVFKGHVLAKRTDVTLDADLLTVSYADVKQPDGTSKTDVTHLEATGGVVIVTSRERITGDRAVMNPKTNELEVDGNVTVVQGTSTIRGGHLHANLDTHKMEVTGGRVKGNFLPK
jgi:lipopolysaccharide export system protein LptA